jgi:CRISPR/Cas system-associated exonuclease Cas4 (RecB family)
MPLYKLSPSQLTFAWDECPRCFYLKAVLGIERPSQPFPKIFTRIDALMKRLFEGQPTSTLSPELPAGRVALQGKWVTSAPISFPGLSASCYIKGAFDSVLAFDDGSYAVIDFKTSSPSPDHVGFYGRQLSAYAYALEHPGEKALHLSPVTRLGLFYLEPRDLRPGAGWQELVFENAAVWQELPKDEAQFLAFMRQVLELLSLPEPPPASPECGFCTYRQAAREHRL